MKFIVTTTDMVSSPDYKSTGGLTMVTGVFETYMDARRSIQGFVVPDGRRLGFPTLIRKYGNMPKDIVWSDVAKSNRINPIISIRRRKSNKWNCICPQPRWYFTIDLQFHL